MMDFAAAGEAFRRAVRRAEGGLGAARTRARRSSCSICTPREFGYTEIAPPYLVRDETAFGTGNLPKAAEDMFRTTNGMWLIPTAEDAADQSGRRRNPGRKATLPLRFTAWTPCFRSEAGAAGQDTRGHDPPAPVSQGRAGLDRPTRRIPPPSTSA